MLRPVEQEQDDPHLDPHLAALAAELGERVEGLAAEAANLIRDQIEFYRMTSAVTEKDLRNNLRANLVFALSGIGGAGQTVDVSEARQTGRRRAAAGVPLPSVMDAYRVGSRFLWRVLVEEAAKAGTVTSEALVAAASDVWLIQEEFTQAMVSGYREEQTAQILAHEQERSAMVEALLEGRVTETTTLWEIADMLRIGKTGPYVVVAAELAQLGRQSLVGVETALQVADIASAWRLMPDLQVGIVCLRRPAHLRRLIVTLKRLATCRVGVSPPFEQLARTGMGLRLARIAMTGSIPAKSLVTVFESDALAVTAVSAPEVTRRVAAHVFAGLNSVPQPERKLLLDTFEAWLDCAGSTADTAAKIFCHHNTVRHRLHRLEQHTGKSLTVPRELAELCLAVEIERRLPAAPDVAD
jgi:hypothetical protein